MRYIEGPDELRAAEGYEAELSAWHTVSQDAIDMFAILTGDRHWIHTEPERARERGLDSTIAHGLYTLSIAPMLYTFKVIGFRTLLHYGYDRVRFPAAVPVRSRIRMGTTIAEVNELPDGFQYRVDHVFELEGSEKPACVASSLTRAGV